MTDHNGRRAAIRAGYSVKSAAQQASRLLTKANIASRTRELLAATFAPLDVTASRIHAEYAAIAFASPSQFGTVNEAGDVVLFPWEPYPGHAFQAVAEIESMPTAYGTKRKLKMHDKLAALKALRELIGMDPDDTPEATAQAIRDAIRELDDFTFVDPPPKEE